MGIIDFYFSKDDGFDVRHCCISDWYLKPGILSCLALKSGSLYVTCSKYGCRQFLPEYSKSYPVGAWYIDASLSFPRLYVNFDSASLDCAWFNSDVFRSKLF